MLKIWAAAVVSSHGTTYAHKAFSLNLCAYQGLATKQKKFTQSFLLKQSDPQNLGLFRLTVLCSKCSNKFHQSMSNLHYQRQALAEALAM